MRQVQWNKLPLENSSITVGPVYVSRSVAFQISVLSFSLRGDPDNISCEVDGGATLSYPSKVKKKSSDPKCIFSTEESSELSKIHTILSVPFYTNLKC